MTSKPTGRAEHRSIDKENGQITAMLIVFSICLLTAVIAVTDISASYLRRQAASSLADGAVLAASDAAAEAGIYGSADDEFVTVDESAAAAAVSDYLTRARAFSDYPGLDVDVAVNGHTVTVRLAMPYELPIFMPGVPDSTTIHGTASAVLPIY